MSVDVARGKDGAEVHVSSDPVDSGSFNTLWTCEKWYEDQVNYARKCLRRLGKSVIQDGMRPTRNGEKTWDNSLQMMVDKIVMVPRLIPIRAGVTSQWLRDLKLVPEVVEVPGNLLLNEGIQELWDLAIAAGGTTAYNNANADIGVGDSVTAEAATQTDLQAASNKLFKAMVATYPIRTNQTVDFRSDFLTAEANYAWAEWSVRNGNTRNKNLNRKVQALGTKSTGTWTLTASITIS
jgi:hypothetical protein